MNEINKIKMLKNYELKLKLIEEFKTTLNKNQSKKVDKLLAFYPQLSVINLIDFNNNQEMNVLLKNKSDNIKQELLQYNQQIQEIILKNSTKNVNDYKVGDMIYFYNKKYKVIGFSDNNKLIVTVNSTNEIKIFPINMVSKELQTKTNVLFAQYERENNVLDRINCRTITTDISTFLINYALDLYYTDVYYQRDLVWTIKQKQEYIRALLRKNIKFKCTLIYYSYEKMQKTGYEYEVLDGKQRMNAIIEFVENKFPIDDIYFKDLSIEDLNYFYHLPIETDIIQYYDRFANQKDLTMEDTIELFLRINDYGTRMDLNHVEKIKKMLQ